MLHSALQLSLLIRIIHYRWLFQTAHLRTSIIVPISACIFSPRCFLILYAEISPWEVMDLLPASGKSCFWTEIWRSIISIGASFPKCIVSILKYGNRTESGRNQSSLFHFYGKEPTNDGVTHFPSAYTQVIISTHIFTAQHFYQKLQVMQFGHSLSKNSSGFWVTVWQDFNSKFCKLGRDEVGQISVVLNDLLCSQPFPKGTLRTSHQAAWEPDLSTGE